MKSRLASEEYELAALSGELATGKERMNLLLGRDLAHDFDVVAVPETTLEEADLPWLSPAPSNGVPISRRRAWPWSRPTPTAG